MVKCSIWTRVVCSRNICMSEWKNRDILQIPKLNEKEYKGEWIVDTAKGFAKADAHVDLEVSTIS